MYIESIELDNFKSFGEKILIPLFPGFTSVSGPNGSGKSNIIDSLLFAFGLSTNKTMRAERVTDLMNNLSGKSETNVSVVLFDEKDNSQIKISRKVRLKKNNQHESSYFLNDKLITLAQMHDYLALKNISSNAYNIVMQGDVTRIITMSGLERRRIIDELAGVAQFDRKIDEAKKEIEIAVDKLNTQAILLSELSERLEVLKKERDIAIKYRDLRNNRNYLERTLKEVRLRELENKITKIQAEIGVKAQEKIDLNSALGDYSEEIFKIEKEIEEIEKLLEEKNNNERKALRQDFDNAKEYTNKIESSIEYIKKQEEDYKRQIDKNFKENKSKQAKIEESQCKVDELNQKEIIVKNNLKEYQFEYEKVQKKILQQSGSISNSKIFELQEEQNNLQKVLSEAKTQKALTEEKLRQNEETIITARKDLENLLNYLKESESKMKKSALQTLQDKIESLNKYLVRLRDEKREAESEIKELVEHLRDIERKLSKMQMKKEVSEEHNFGRSIEAVLKSGIDGVHGVLAQLGNTASEYSLALEISAGARLKSIVVEDDSIGAKLIEFLKKNNLGRATFLPLNKFQDIGSFPSIKNRFSGVIDWAFNLVKCDSLYLPVFAYAFGSTLIMKDLSSARKILGNYRMVTLEGDLLEKSGAMTGGSYNSNAGIAFGNKENRELEDLKKKYDILNSRINNSQASLRETQAEIAQNERDLQVLREEFVKLRALEEVDFSNYETAKTKSEEGRNYLFSLSKQRDEFENELKLLDKNLFITEKNLKRASDMLVAETCKMKDSGLELLINSSQEIEFERKACESNLHNLEIEKNDFLKEIEMMKASVLQNNNENEEFRLKINELKNKAVEQEALLKDSCLRLKELEDTLIILEQEINSFNSKKNNLSKSLINLTQKKTELVEKLKRNSQEIAELKMNLMDLEQRVNALKQEEVIDEELDLEMQKQININLKECSESELKAELDRLEREMKKLEPVNMKAITEYDEIFDKVNEVRNRCDNIQEEKLEIEKRILDYSEHKFRSFFEAYDSVNKHFQEIFAELSFGHGELMLENSSDPFSGGLFIQARPRNKKMQRLESMSGGEKSLTALSFLFALQWHNPAPFYAFDEVDMFLDGLNVERLSRMIKKQSELAQFIVVTLRKPMLERSKRAIGVCLGKEGFSKVSGVKLNVHEEEKYKEKEKQEALV